MTTAQTADSVFTCTFAMKMDVREIRIILAISIMAAELRFNQEIQERDGRFNIDEKSRSVQIDTSTAFGKSMAHMFIVLIREMFVEGEYALSGPPVATRTGTRTRRRSG